MKTLQATLIQTLLLPFTNALFHDFRKVSDGQRKTVEHCNLHGQIVKAITVEEEPFVVFNSTCIDTSHISKNSHIDVTRCVHGWVVEVVKALGNNCNFTLQAYTLSNLTYGDVMETEDGTLAQTGLFAEIEKFDIILGASFITIPRLKVVNYFTDLGFDRMAIFIKNDIGEQEEWWMYVRIFSSEVWLALLSIALIPSILVSIKDSLLHGERVKSISQIGIQFISSFALNFGGNFFDSRNRGLILVSHLSYGIIIWIFFRGSLTSKLTSRIYNYPFTTLEELSNTDYSLFTLNRNTKAANDFLNAPQGSVYHRILENNIDLDKAFIGVEKSFKAMFETSMAATYSYEQVGSHALAKKKQFCETLIPWKSQIRFPYSIAVNIKFKFYDQLNLTVQKLKESGSLKRLIAKYDRMIQNNCMREEEVTIGYEKVFPLFIVLSFGMLGSLLYMFMAEMVCQKKN